MPSSGDIFGDAKVVTLGTTIHSGGRIRIPSVDLACLDSQKDPIEIKSAKFYAIRNASRTVWAYRLCRHRDFWRPNVPESIAEAGSRANLCIRFITLNFFIDNLGKIEFRSKIRNAPRLVELTLKEGNEGRVVIRLTQEALDSTESFEVTGIPTEIQDSNGTPRLVLKIGNVFGRMKKLAIYHDGTSHPTLGVEDGRQFRIAQTIFSDGVRLVIAYPKFRGTNLWTSYLKSPAELYSITARESQPFKWQGKQWPIFNVELRRSLERRMLLRGSAYEHGRLGAEIAHTIAAKFLGLSNPVIGEPSSGGKDLWTIDNGFTVQARLIVDFRQFLPLTQEEAIVDQITSLAQKIGQDFANSKKTHTGFVVFSYVDEEKAIHSLVIERKRKGAKQERMSGPGGI